MKINKGKNRGKKLQAKKHKTAKRKKKDLQFLSQACTEIMKIARQKSSKNKSKKPKLSVSIIKSFDRPFKPFFKYGYSKDSKLLLKKTVSEKPKEFDVISSNSTIDDGPFEAPEYRKHRTGRNLYTKTSNVVKIPQDPEKRRELFNENLKRAYQQTGNAFPVQFERRKSMQEFSIGDKPRATKFPQKVSSPDPKNNQEPKISAQDKEKQISDYVETMQTNVFTAIDTEILKSFRKKFRNIRIELETANKVIYLSSFPSEDAKTDSSTALPQQDDEKQEEIRETLNIIHDLQNWVVDCIAKLDELDQTISKNKVTSTDSNPSKVSISLMNPDYRNAIKDLVQFFDNLPNCVHLSNYQKLFKQSPISETLEETTVQSEVSVSSEESSNSGSESEARFEAIGKVEEHRIILPSSTKLTKFSDFNFHIPANVRKSNIANDGFVDILKANRSSSVLNREAPKKTIATNIRRSRRDPGDGNGEQKSKTRKHSEKKTATNKKDAPEQKTQSTNSSKKKKPSEIVLPLERPVISGTKQPPKEGIPNEPAEKYKNSLFFSIPSADPPQKCKEDHRGQKCNCNCQMFTEPAPKGMTSRELAQLQWMQAKAALLKHRDSFNCYDMLDELCLKDLAPLQAEYPRKDFFKPPHYLKAENTFLYNVVFSKKKDLAKGLLYAESVRSIPRRKGDFGECGLDNIKNEYSQGDLRTRTVTVMNCTVRYDWEKINNCMGIQKKIVLKPTVPQVDEFSKMRAALILAPYIYLLGKDEPKINRANYVVCPVSVKHNVKIPSENFKNGLCDKCERNLNCKKKRPIYEHMPGIIEENYQTLNKNGSFPLQKNTPKVYDNVLSKPRKTMRVTTTNKLTILRPNPARKDSTENSSKPLSNISFPKEIEQTKTVNKNNVLLEEDNSAYLQNVADNLETIEENVSILSDIKVGEEILRQLRFVVENTNASTAEMCFVQNYLTEVVKVMEKRLLQAFSLPKKARTLEYLRIEMEILEVLNIVYPYYVTTEPNETFKKEDEEQSSHALLLEKLKTILSSDSLNVSQEDAKSEDLSDVVAEKLGNIDEILNRIEVVGEDQMNILYETIPGLETVEEESFEDINNTETQEINKVCCEDEVINKESGMSCDVEAKEIFVEDNKTEILQECDEHIQEIHTSENDKSTPIEIEENTRYNFTSVNEESIPIEIEENFTPVNEESIPIEIEEYFTPVNEESIPIEVEEKFTPVNEESISIEIEENFTTANEESIPIEIEENVQSNFEENISELEGNNNYEVNENIETKSIHQVETKSKLVYKKLLEELMNATKICKTVSEPGVKQKVEDISSIQNTEILEATSSDSDFNLSSSWDSTILNTSSEIPLEKKKPVQNFPIAEEYANASMQTSEVLLKEKISQEHLEIRTIAIGTSELNIHFLQKIQEAAREFTENVEHLMINEETMTSATSIVDAKESKKTSEIEELETIEDQTDAKEEIIKTDSVHTILNFLDNVSNFNECVPEYELKSNDFSVSQSSIIDEKSENIASTNETTAAKSCESDENLSQGSKTHNKKSKYTEVLETTLNEIKVASVDIKHEIVEVIVGDMLKVDEEEKPHKKIVKPNKNKTQKAKEIIKKDNKVIQGNHKWLLLIYGFLFVFMYVQFLPGYYACH